MEHQPSVEKSKLLRVVTEAIVSATKKETAISSVRLGSIFQINHTVIEKYLDEFVDEGHIIRVHSEDNYPRVIYRLPQ